MKLAGLKYIRKEFGLTMRDLAKCVDVSHNAINIWENGEVEISENNLKHLIRFFGLESEYFFKEEFNYEDKMMIEMARSKYKVEEYKSLILSDKKTTKDMIDKLTKKTTLHRFDLCDENEANMILEILLEKVIGLYSSINDYEVFEMVDDAMQRLVDIIIRWNEEFKDEELHYRILDISYIIRMMGEDENGNRWKLKSITECLDDSENCSYSLEYDKEILDLSAEQALWKSIITNLDVLYRLSRKR